MSWTFAGEERPAALAETILGYAELCRQSELVRGRWLATAADERARDLSVHRLDEREDAA